MSQVLVSDRYSASRSPTTIGIRSNAVTNKDYRVGKPVSGSKVELCLRRSDQRRRLNARHDRSVRTVVNDEVSFRGRKQVGVAREVRLSYARRRGLSAQLGSHRDREETDELCPQISVLLRCGQVKRQQDEMPENDNALFARALQ